MKAMKRFIFTTLALATSMYYFEAVADPWMTVPFMGDLAWGSSVMAAFWSWR